MYFGNPRAVGQYIINLVDDGVVFAPRSLKSILVGVLRHAAGYTPEIIKDRGFVLAAPGGRTAYEFVQGGLDRYTKPRPEYIWGHSWDKVLKPRQFARVQLAQWSTYKPHQERMLKHHQNIVDYKLVPALPQFSELPPVSNDARSVTFARFIEAAAAGAFPTPKR
jgi:hypothetical protein